MTQKRKTNSTNFLNEQNLKAQCPMQYAVQRIGGRWKMMIVWYIHHRVNRFSTLRQHIPEITSKMLTQQLHELQTDGLILRIIVSNHPSHVEYELTTRALPLIPILSALNDWAQAEQAEVNTTSMCSVAIPAFNAAEVN